MTAINKYLELKENVEEAERQANQAEGALGQVMKQLKTEFGCSTIEAANKKLKKLQQQVNVAEKSFNTAVEVFEEKWENELGD